jgi:hypothetical protein
LLRGFAVPHYTTDLHARDKDFLTCPTIIHKSQREVRRTPVRNHDSTALRTMLRTAMPLVCLRLRSCTTYNFATVECRRHCRLQHSYGRRCRPLLAVAKSRCARFAGFSLRGLRRCARMTRGGRHDCAGVTRGGRHDCAKMTSFVCDSLDSRPSASREAYFLPVIRSRKAHFLPVIFT